MVMASCHVGSKNAAVFVVKSGVELVLPGILSAVEFSTAISPNSDEIVHPTYRDGTNNLKQVRFKMLFQLQKVHFFVNNSVKINPFYYWQS